MHNYLQCYNLLFGCYFYYNVISFLYLVTAFVVKSILWNWVPLPKISLCSHLFPFNLHVYLVQNRVICRMHIVFIFLSIYSGYVFCSKHLIMGFPGSSTDKEICQQCRRSGSIPGLGSSPGEGIGYPLQHFWASLVVQLVKNLLAMWGNWVGKIPWRRTKHPLQYSCLENPHGQRNLVGYPTLLE